MRKQSLENLSHLIVKWSTITKQIPRMQNRKTEVDLVFEDKWKASASRIPLCAAMSLIPIPSEIGGIDYFLFLGEANSLYLMTASFFVQIWLPLYIRLSLPFTTWYCKYLNLSLVL